LIVKFIFEALGIPNISYVDIGAHHPRYINNTAIFYDTGSRGINIEPDPSLFEAFKRDRPTDINLNLGVSNEGGTLDFFLMSAATLNTFSSDEAKNFQKEGFSIINRIKIRTENINRILGEWLGGAPDFISLDAEGLDFEILKSFDFRKYAPSVWCIETISFSQSGRGQKDQELISYLENKGYLLYADTYINSIFVKKTLWQR
jgi:FkbM family methyltransferase